MRAIPHVTTHRRKVTPRFFVVVAIFIVTLYLGYGYVKGFVRMRALHREVAQVQQQIAELEQRNLELERRIALYDSNAFVERAAREELGLVNPGEIPVIVVDGPPAERFEPIH